MLETLADQLKARTVMRYVGVICGIFDTAILVGLGFWIKHLLRIDLCPYIASPYIVVIFSATTAVLIFFICALVRDIAFIAGYKKQWVHWTKWEEI